MFLWAGAEAVCVRLRHETILSLDLSDTGIWLYSLTQATDNLQLTWEKNIRRETENRGAATKFARTDCSVIHTPRKITFSEREMLAFWRNFYHWLHWKLSFWQLPVQPVMKISSKWRHSHFSVICIKSVYQWRLLRTWVSNHIHYFVWAALSMC